MLSVARKDLSAALALVARVAERKSVMPALAKVHLTRDAKGRLQASCTDLYTFASVAVACEGDGPIDAALDVRAVVDRLKRFKNGHLEIVAPPVPEPAHDGHVPTEGTHVALVEGTRRYDLPWIAGSDFPPVPDLGASASLLVSCEAATLANLIDRVLFAASDDETRAHLNAVCWEVSPGEVRLIATDGHRLSMHAESMPTPFLGDEKAVGLVSLSSMGHVRAALGKKPAGRVQVRVSPPPKERDAEGQLAGHLHVTYGDASIVARLVDAQFPPWRQVVPDAERCERSVTCDRAALLEAIGAVVVAASERTGGIKVTFEADRIVLVAESLDEGKAREEVSAHGRGASEPLTVGFNAQYLRDALSACEARYVTLSTSGVLDPLRVDCDGTVGIVMPMRI